MGIESPFQLFSPSTAIELGIALSMFGVLIIGIAASPVGQLATHRQRLVLTVSLTAIGVSSVYVDGWIETAWNWIALFYAVGLPTLIAITGVRALVAPSGSR